MYWFMRGNAQQHGRWDGGGDRAPTRPLGSKSPETERGHGATRSTVIDDRWHTRNDTLWHPNRLACRFSRRGPGVLARSSPAEYLLVQYLGIPAAKLSYESEGAEDVGIQYISCMIPASNWLLAFRSVQTGRVPVRSDGPRSYHQSEVNCEGHYSGIYSSHVLMRMQSCQTPKQPSCTLRVLVL